jgi:hypothetical protein
MSVASRLALAGIAGLAALTASQWLRVTLEAPGPMLSAALGVLPSLTAAFAMPLVVASWLPGVARSPPTATSWRRFGLVLAATTAGLLGWECVQAASVRLVFDVADLAATVVGALAAMPAYRAAVR